MPLSSARRRFCWLVVWCVSIGLLAVFSSARYTKFKGYPVSTTISRLNLGAAFPRVTMCSVNPISYDKAQAAAKRAGADRKNMQAFDFDDARALGYTLPELMRSCTFTSGGKYGNHSDCLPTSDVGSQGGSNWLEYIHPTYGRCYQTNFTHAQVNFTGEDGMAIEVETFPGDYIEGGLREDGETGVLVALHSADTPPDMVRATRVSPWDDQYGGTVNKIQ